MGKKQELAKTFQNRNSDLSSAVTKQEESPLNRWEDSTGHTPVIPASSLHQAKTSHVLEKPKNTESYTNSFSSQAVLKKLWSKGTDFLGCDVALLGGAMTWVSNSTLVSAISEAGGFGVLAGGSFSPEELEAEIIKTQQQTSKPFGVNLIVFHPAIEGLMSVCCQQKVSHVFLGGGIPSQRMISVLQEAQCRVVGFSPSVIIGKKLIRMGIDALVIEGSEAGGHVGPVSTSVLAQEILPQLSNEVPIFVAGGIGEGSTVVGYLLMGAAGCQLGTRFVCASQSPAHPRFKEAFMKAQSRDAILSVQIDPLFPVIPVRGLANKGTAQFMQLQKQMIQQYHEGHISQKEAQLKIEMFWSGALRRAVLDGDVEEGSVMAGQSVGLVNKIAPCQEIIDDLCQEALDTLDRLYDLKSVGAF